MNKRLEENICLEKAMELSRRGVFLVCRNGYIADLQIQKELELELPYSNDIAKEMKKE